MNEGSVKIVQASKGSPKLGFGSMVLMPNGDPMPNVKGVEITCPAADCFWEAKITCFVQFDELEALASFVNQKQVSWWRVLLIRLAMAGASFSRNDAWTVNEQCQKAEMDALLKKRRR